MIADLKHLTIVRAFLMRCDGGAREPRALPFADGTVDPKESHVVFATRSNDGGSRSISTFARLLSIVQAMRGTYPTLFC
jgi:hypothetical protein